MKKFVLSTLLVGLLTGCSHKKIEITREYIINEHWNKRNDVAGGNSMKIEKMKVKKDSIFYPNQKLDEAIIEKLEVDSTFRWFTNVKIQQESYENRRVYFNKDNGFTWLDDVSNKRTRVFGNLEKGNWYKFSDLVSYPYYVYVYIDSLNHAHQFDKNLANY